MPKHRIVDKTWAIKAVLTDSRVMYFTRTTHQKPMLWADEQAVFHNLATIVTMAEKETAEQLIESWEFDGSPMHINGVRISSFEIIKMETQLPSSFTEEEYVRT